MSTRCKHCGETGEQMVCAVLLSSMGARISWNPSRCSSGPRQGRKHEMVDDLTPASLGKEEPK